MMNWTKDEMAERTRRGPDAPSMPGSANLPPGRWPAAPRPCVSETIGFDSRVASVPARAVGAAGPLRYEHVSVGEARAAADGAPAAQASGYPAGPRTDRAPEILNDATLRWVVGLPPPLRPLQLGRRFPRIANKLCDLWSEPCLCNRYLSELLLDTRDGERQGFPIAVATELAALLGSINALTTGPTWSHVKSGR